MTLRKKILEWLDYKISEDDATYVEKMLLTDKTLQKQFGGLFVGLYTNADIYIKQQMNVEPESISLIEPKITSNGYKRFKLNPKKWRLNVKSSTYLEPVKFSNFTKIPIKAWGWFLSSQNGDILLINPFDHEYIIENGKYIKFDLISKKP